MVISHKGNGDPQCIIDLSLLNQHCKKGVHDASVPFELVKAVQARTWRTVTDAWNGFQNVPFQLKDRNLSSLPLGLGFRIEE